MVKNINPIGGSDTWGFTAIGNTFYFAADDGTNGKELWKSDGTAAGTIMVKNIYPSANGYPSYLTALGSTLYFRAYEDTHGWEVWKSDGTEAGTTLLKDINPTGASFPISLTRQGNLLYFLASDGVNGTEVYVSDGTEAGTIAIPGPIAADYVSCRCDDHPIMSTAAGVYFTYYDATVGHELGFIPDPLPETNTNSNALTVALLVLSGALAAGAVIARRNEHRAN
jgi:ELWxxDGT repeat protein